MSPEEAYNIDEFINKLYSDHHEEKTGREPTSAEELDDYKVGLAKKRKALRRGGLFVLALNYAIPLLVAAFIFKIIFSGIYYDIFLSIINIVLILLITLFNFYLQGEHNSLRDFLFLMRELRCFRISGNPLTKNVMMGYVNKYNQIMGNHEISFTIDTV